MHTNSYSPLRNLQKKLDDLLTRGMSKLLVARTLRVSYQRVKEHLYDVNALKILSKETLNKIRWLFASDVSKTDISKRLHVSPATEENTLLLQN